MTVCWRKVHDSLHPSSTIMPSESIATLWLVEVANSNILWCWWDKFFSISFKSLSHNVSINFFYWTLFLFFYFVLLYLSTRFLCLLTCLSFVSLESSVAFHRVLEFLFFVFFRMLRMLFAVDNANFHYGNIDNFQ